MINTAEHFSASLNERLFSYIWKLLRLRWILFLSSLKHSKTRQKIGYGVLLLIAIGLMVGAFVLSWVILNFLNSPRLVQYLGNPGPFLSTVPTLIFIATFAGILLTSFGVMLQALYLANDMDFLLSAPIPIRAVFVSKLLQAVLPNFGLVSLFGIPVLFGLGASQHYNVLFFPLVLVILMLLALAAAGLASLLVMGIVRIFPARRVAEVLAFMGAIFSFICGQSGQIFRFQSNPIQTTNTLNSLTRLNASWFPLSWAGRCLVAIGQGNWFTGVVELGLVFGLTGLIFWFSLSTAERLYYNGWATTQITVRKKKRPTRISTLPVTESPITSWIEPIIPTPVRAIIFKDFQVLRRDLRNLSQLVTPLIFGVLYTFILLRDTRNVPGNNSFGTINTLATYGNTAIALFVGWMLLMRLALIAFSQEGKNYWLIKSSPVPPNWILTAKFMVAFLPATSLGWILLIVTSLLHHAGIGTTIYGLLVVTGTFAGLSGLLLAFGVIGANFEWNDPRQMVRNSAGCFGSLIGMGYIAISGGLFYGPSILGQIAHINSTWTGVTGLVLGGVLSLACALIPLQVVYQRVIRLDEQ